MLKKGWETLERSRPNIHSELHRHGWLRNRPTGSLLKYIPLALGIILILVALVSGLSRLCAKKPASDVVVAPLNEPKENIHFVTDPPPPYLK